ncbi:MAG TPA: response regulator [Gemmataceae bacterium]|jgi:CheY-like chemotaxis protein|nr:response regulator [Gemmataceae bacterium]
MIATPQIILIDDNIAWLDSLADYLRAKGLMVFTASDPRRGLELLEGHAVTVVICDFNLPFMDGLQVLRDVRSRGGNVSVLLLTSEEEPELEKKVLAEGAVGFFCKTTEPALLLRGLLQAIAALAVAQQVPAVLETWQRLLPNPYSSGHRNRFGQQGERGLEVWQRLLPNPHSGGRLSSFARERMPKPAA